MGPSWAVPVPTAYSPGRWLFGSCLGIKNVLKSPQKSRLDLPHLASEPRFPPLALESGCLGSLAKRSSQSQPEEVKKTLALALEDLDLSLALLVPSCVWGSRKSRLWRQAWH